MNFEPENQLDGAGAGEASGLPALATIYPRLRRIAEALRRRQAPEFTLGPTDLVHEALLRLAGADLAAWKGVEHFYVVAATAIRQALVDHARRRKSAKRGGLASFVAFDEESVSVPPRPEHLVRLDELLSELAAADARKARVVELRVFCGLSMEEIAETVGVSKPTVERDWRSALTWLGAGFRDG